MSSIDCDRPIRPAALALAALLAACGGGQSDLTTPAPTPGLDGKESTATDREEAHRSDQESLPGTGGKAAMTVKSSKGYLAPEKIQAGIAPHQAALSSCYHDRLKQLRFLSGRVMLHIQVEPSGRVSGARLPESSLGDWTAERCVLETARSMTFAKPTGGPADFSLPLDFASDQPPLEEWGAERVQGVAAAHAAELDRCADQAGGRKPSVLVTLYIGNRGEVKAVGFSKKDVPPPPDAWADCAARAVAGWKFADPQGKIVKSSFRYPAGQGSR
jgi:TonB family protein